MLRVANFEFAGGTQKQRWSKLDLEWDRGPRLRSQALNQRTTLGEGQIQRNHLKRPAFIDGRFRCLEVSEIECNCLSIQRPVVRRHRNERIASIEDLALTLLLSPSALSELLRHAQGG